MADLREQHIAAWASRRADETRAMLATAGQPPKHAWRGDGQCPLCGVVGWHGGEEVEEAADPRPWMHGPERDSGGFPGSGS
jgi:hypothetical protein